MANNKKKKGRKKSALKTTLAEANALKNPLQGLEPFLDMQYSSSIKIQYYASPLPEPLLNSCMKLFEANMSNLYRNSAWGFNLEEKELEMRHADAKFLIALNENKLVGFAHFRFESNDDDCPTEPVLYVYEIQVSRKGCGLGRRLMSIMELVALKTKMRKVMLTVFLANEGAMSFYKDKMKYQIDESSPSQYVGGSADYEIMSKAILQK